MSGGLRHRHTGSSLQDRTSRWHYKIHLLKGFEYYLFRIESLGDVVLLVAAVFVSHAATTATSKSTAPARGYYLTTRNFDGSQLLTTCASGYHRSNKG
jgi:hypothetical protein